jgi:hypothetical protein
VGTTRCRPVDVSLMLGRRAAVRQPSLSSLGETGDGQAMTEFEGEMGPYEDDRIDSP